jgi:hypothetical protein
MLMAYRHQGGGDGLARVHAKRTLERHKTDHAR